MCHCGLREITMDKVQSVKAFLGYDPTTGNLWWKVTRGRQKVGKSAGNDHSAGYRELSCNGVRMFAHQAIWAIMTGEWPEFQIDHRNGVRNDNRWENLRSAQQVQNSANMMRRRNNKCGYKGVVNDKGKFRAYIHTDGKIKYLGTFPNAVVAHKAYCDAAQAHWGSYARAS